MKIKVGCTDYDLKVTDYIESSNGYSPDTICLGQHDGYNCEIFLLKDVNIQVQLQTLFHEVAHAIMYEIYDDEKYIDEKFIDLLGKQIYQLIMNNKFDKIIEFISKKNSKK